MRRRSRSRRSVSLSLGTLVTSLYFSVAAVNRRIAVRLVGPELQVRIHQVLEVRHEEIRRDAAAGEEHEQQQEPFELAALASRRRRAAAAALVAGHDVELAASRTVVAVVVAVIAGAPAATR